MIMYDLDRTGMKKMDKNGKNCMHWNVARMHPDALPGSVTFVCVLDRWLNDRFGCLRLGMRNNNNK